MTQINLSPAQPDSSATMVHRLDASTAKYPEAVSVFDLIAELIQFITEVDQRMRNVRQEGGLIQANAANMQSLASYQGAVQEADCNYAGRLEGAHGELFSSVLSIVGATIGVVGKGMTLRGASDAAGGLAEASNQGLSQSGHFGKSFFDTAAAEDLRDAAERAALVGYQHRVAEQQEQGSRLTIEQGRKVMSDLQTFLDAVYGLRAQLMSSYK